MGAVVISGARSSAWLERTPDKREAGSSNLPGPIFRCQALEYLGRGWATVRVDMSPFGFVTPDPISCLSLRYHLAHKIHAMTAPSTDEQPNVRFRDLVDILLLRPPIGGSGSRGWPRTHPIPRGCRCRAGDHRRGGRPNELTHPLGTFTCEPPIWKRAEASGIRPRTRLRSALRAMPTTVWRGVDPSHGLPDRGRECPALLLRQGAQAGVYFLVEMELGAHHHATYVHRRGCALSIRPGRARLEG